MDTCHRHAGMTKGGWISASANTCRGKLYNGGDDDNKMDARLRGHDEYVEDGVVFTMAS